MNKDILQGIFDALDNHIAIVDQTGTIIAVNEAWERFGYANSVCGAFINQDYLEICNNIHGQGMGVEDAKASYEGIKTVLEGDLPNFSLEYFCHSATKQRWYRMDVKPLTDQPLAMISHLDITERKNAEDLERGRTQILELLVNDTSLNKILETLAKHAETMRPDMLCSVLLLDATGTRLKHGAAPSLPSFYIEAIDGLEIGAEVGSCGAAAYTAERVIAEDIQQHPYWLEYRSLAEQSELRSCWSEPIKDSRGKVLGTFGMYYRKPRTPTESDISFIKDQALLAALAIEKSRLNKALRTSEQRMANHLENTPLAVIERNAENKLIGWNKAAEKIFGYSREEMLALGSIASIVPESERNQLETVWQVLLEGTGERHSINKNITKDGHGIICDWHNTILTNESGEVIGVASLVQDISAQLQNNALLEAMFKALPDPLMITNPKRQLIMANPAVSKVFGYDTEEILGKQASILYESQAEFEKQGRLRFNLNAEEQFKPYVVNYQRKTGEVFPGETVGTVIHDADGNSLGFLGLIRDISEHQHIETLLQGSEQKFRTLAENIPGVIYLCNNDQVYSMIYVNDAIETLFGHPKEAFLQHDLHFADLFHPEDQEYIYHSVEKALAARQAFYLQYRLKHLNGQWRWVEETGVGVFENDELLYLEGFLTDITERKRAEEALQQSEQRLRLLVENLPAGAIFVDGETLYLNRAVEEMTGYQRQDINTLRDWFNILYGDQATAVRNLYEMDKKTGFLVSRTVPVKHKDGTKRFVNFAACKEEQGEVWLLNDVTERYHAEAQVKQLAAIVEFSDDAIISKTLEGIITSWNAGAEHIYGYSAAEMLGQSISKLLPPEQDNELPQLLAKIKRNEIVEPYETTRLRKDGEKIVVSLRLSPIEDSNGQVIGASVIARDITASKRDEQRLRQVLNDMIEAQRKEYEAREIIELNSRLAQESSLTDMSQQLANWLVAKSGGIASGVLLLSGNPPLPRWMGSCGIPENIIASVNAAYREGRTEIVDRLIHAEDITLIKDVYTMIKGANPDISNLLQTERVAWNTLLGVPFEYLKRRVGILIVCYHKDQSIPKHEVAFLKAVAKQSVYMLENARLFAENQDRAALDERSRLARELHDSVSQAIYGIALGVRSARDQLDKNPEMVAARLDYAHKLAEAATTEMRALIFELRPESLEQEGLVEALRKLAVANEARHHLKVISEFCEEPDLPLDTKQALFRIVQEAIHNTVKHARAQQVKLCLCYEQNGLDLLIADDGIGFDVKASFHGHLGLSSMRERANLIGAEFELASQAGEGTTLRLRLPLSATSEVARPVES